MRRGVCRRRRWTAPNRAHSDLGNTPSPDSSTIFQWACDVPASGWERTGRVISTFLPRLRVRNPHAWRGRRHAVPGRRSTTRQPTTAPRNRTAVADSPRLLKFVVRRHQRSVRNCDVDDEV